MRRQYRRRPCIIIEAAVERLPGCLSWGRSGQHRTGAAEAAKKSQQIQAPACCMQRSTAVSRIMPGASLTHNQERAGGVSGNRSDHRTNEHALDGAAAFVPEDDEVALLLSSGIKECPTEVATLE